MKLRSSIPSSERLPGWIDGVTISPIAPEYSLNSSQVVADLSKLNVNKYGFEKFINTPQNPFLVGKEEDFPSGELTRHVSSQCI